MATRTWGVIVAAVGAALLMVAGVVTPAAAGLPPMVAAAAAPALATEPTPDRPDEEQVRAEVAPAETVAIGVASDAGDGLTITSVNATGPDQALEVIAQLSADPDTLAVGLPQPLTTFADDVTPMATDQYRIENSPFPLPYHQYALDMLCADTIADAQSRYPCDGYAWATATGKGQVVAIIDQGVATNHPDLAASMGLGARCVDVGTTPCTPLWQTAPADISNHGTHVAGIVNAVAENGLGVAGLARDAKLMPVEVIDSAGTGNTTDLAAGVVWAADNGATVINMSLGTIGSPSDPVLAVAVANAQRMGVVVVAAAGNDGLSGNRIAYPAAYDGVIGVANIDHTQQVAASSSRGTWVDVAAPGSTVLSTMMTADPTWGPYGWMTGTSMASPYVAATVALLRQRQPNMTPAQLVALVTGTAADAGAAGWDPAYGYGIVRTLNALRVGVQPPSPPVEGAAFVPIDPARVLDTRSSNPIGSMSARFVSVSTDSVSQREVVPAGAVGIAYNLTVPTPGVAGHLRVMPGDVAFSSASAINFAPGQTIANGLVVKLDANRMIRIFNAAGQPIHAVVDVVGYFMPNSAGATATGRFTPIPPVRVYDSGAPGVQLLQPAETRNVPVHTGIGGEQNVVPAAASAIAYNITVVEPEASGHLRVMPGDVPTTNASTINWTRAFDKIANGLVVRIAADRTINVYSASGVPVRFLVDVVGYYGSSGGLFYAVPPSRLYDSRQPLPQQGALAPAAERTVNVADGRDAVGNVTAPNVVPSGAAAIAYNATVPQSGVSTGGHLRIWPANQARPNASVLNWPATGATTRANGLVVGISADRKVKAYNGSADANHLIIDALGYYK